MEKQSFLKRSLHSKGFMLIAILIVLVVAMMVYSSGVLDGAGVNAMFTKGFMSSGNLRGIFLGLIVQSVILCGLIGLLIGGNIDLSVSGQMTISAMLFAWLCMTFPGLPWVVAAVICLLFGVVAGLANTALTTIVKLPSFIATIGMSSIYSGIAAVWSRGTNIQINRTGFISIGKAALFDVFPVLFIVAGLLVIFYGFVLSKTTFGRSVYMIGGNRKAARLSGLNPNRITMVLFLNNSVLAALGGMMWAAQMKLASPSALINAGYDLRVIAAIILGGVSFFGGSGFIAGAFAGLLLLNIFDNMLSVVNVPTFWNIFAQGAILILALLFDYLSRRKRETTRLQTKFEH